MDAIETVVFWMAAIWGPGLLLMAYMVILGAVGKPTRPLCSWIQTMKRAMAIG
jgi:hypothetical protein